MDIKPLNCRTARDYFVNFLRYRIIGNTIRIDACTLCQLKCIKCIQSGPFPELIGKGYLRYDDYRRFIDRHTNFRNIELSNWGEIFLNPELKDIIRYSYEKKVDLKAINGVNLNTADEETLEYLVRYRFKYISVSIDGASNDTYRLYRIGGDFNKVMENIKKINYYKDKYGSLLPELRWQFVIFGHNEHEIPKARIMAKELNMAFSLKFNASRVYSPIKNMDLVRREMGAVSRWEYRRERDKLFMFPCHQFWIKPQINWDGKLLGCCVNKWSDFGNVFKSGLRECLESEKYIYTKQMLMGKKPAREDIPCFHCRHYKEMLSNKAFFGYNHIFSRVRV